jgi:hypothetical protein
MIGRIIDVSRPEEMPSSAPLAVHRSMALCGTFAEMKEKKQRNEPRRPTKKTRRGEIVATTGDDPNSRACLAAN